MNPKFFVIGEFDPTANEVHILGPVLVDLLSQKPCLVVLDDEKLNVLQQLAADDLSCTIATDPEWQHLKGFDPKAPDAPDNLIDGYGTLIDQLVVEVFTDRYTPNDEARFVVASDRHDMATPIINELQRLTGRESLPIH
jgi:hypothetical protein